MGLESGAEDGVPEGCKETEYNAGDSPGTEQDVSKDGAVQLLHGIDKIDRDQERVEENQQKGAGFDVSL